MFICITIRRRFRFVGRQSWVVTFLRQYSLLPWTASNFSSIQVVLESVMSLSHAFSLSLRLNPCLSNDRTATYYRLMMPQIASRAPYRPPKYRRIPSGLRHQRITSSFHDVGRPSVPCQLVASVFDRPTQRLFFWYFNSRDLPRCQPAGAGCRSPPCIVSVHPVSTDGRTVGSTTVAIFLSFVTDRKIMITMIVVVFGRLPRRSWRTIFLL